MSKVINIVGYSSNVGKTLLIENLIKELKSRGYSIATIKHDVHGFDIDKKGKDTYKHREAGAETVVISSKNRFAMIKELNEEIEFTQEEKTKIPHSIRTLISKMTEKSPEDRYQSAEEVIEDIDYIEKNIDLDINLEEINYLGNEELLAQVWQNIIGNALKFTNPNGKIKVFMESNDKYIVIDIIDNGIGIDEATQARIFEKFYQGDKSHTIKGNGLGLALSKQIIELHNGSISVSSQKDKGSKFTISLPV